MKLSDKRIKDLLRAEEKLQALENGGVDNWEFYGESMAEYWAKNELEEYITDLFNEMLVELSSGAYEPSERGAGFAFTEEAEAGALKILLTSKLKLSD